MPFPPNNDEPYRHRLLLVLCLNATLSDVYVYIFFPEIKKYKIQLQKISVRLSAKSVFLSRFLKQAGRFLGKGLGQIYIFSARAVTLSQLRLTSILYWF
jgi:hypothetical protein